MRPARAVQANLAMTHVQRCRWPTTPHRCQRPSLHHLPTLRASIERGRGQQTLESCSGWRYGRWRSGGLQRQLRTKLCQEWPIASTEEAIEAHFHEASGQHVLEEAVEKCQRGQRTGFWLVRR